MKLQFFLAFLFCGTLLAADLPRTSFFVANEGQWEAPFAFRYDGAGGSYFVTSDGLTIDLRQYERSAVTEEPDRMPWERRESQPESVRGHVVKVKYLNASTNPEIVGEDRLPHYSNYFLGPDSCRWRSLVGHYRRVMAKNVWAGVDVEYRIEAQGIESVYHLAAGVDPSVIQIQYDGLDAPLRTDIQGNLILQTSLGAIREKAPYACQNWQGKREEVAVVYQIISGNTIRLACSGYDRNIGMVIDPLLYSSYLGGNSGDVITGIDILDDGCILVCGNTYSTDFPTTPGAFQDHRSGSKPGFVTELTADGDSLVFSTYLGGQGYVNPSGIHHRENAFWTAGDIAWDGAIGWPLTVDALDTTWGGGYEGFITCLSADGSELLYSSYLGGSGMDMVKDFTLDTLGSLILVGQTDSDEFPVTADALALNREWGPDGFFTIFNPVQIRLDYSTYIPGNYLDQAGNIVFISSRVVWVVGATSSSNFRVTDDALQSQNASGGGPSSGFNDAFLMEWNLAEHQLVYCSYLGGSGPDGLGDVYALDVNRIVLVGSTRSADFPVTAAAFDTALLGSQDCFITVIRFPDSILYSTYLGGSTYESVFKVTGDEHSLTIAGETAGPDFPITPGAFDTVSHGMFISRLSMDLSRLEYSSYFGGSGIEWLNGVYFTSADTVWLVGETGSGNFPITANAYQSLRSNWSDGFLSEFVIPDSISPVTVRPVPIPSEISLSIYPNPFNSTAQIAYSLPTTQRVSLRLYNVLGREAAMLLNERQIAGEHRVQFNCSGLSSGVYFCRMETGREVRTRKIVLMR